MRLLVFSDAELTSPGSSYRFKSIQLRYKRINSPSLYVVEEYRGVKYFHNQSEASPVL